MCKDNAYGHMQTPCSYGSGDQWEGCWGWSIGYSMRKTDSVDLKTESVEQLRNSKGPQIIRVLLKKKARLLCI